MTAATINISSSEDCTSDVNELDSKFATVEADPATIVTSVTNSDLLMNSSCRTSIGYSVTSNTTTESTNSRYNSTAESDSISSAPETQSTSQDQDQVEFSSPQNKISKKNLSQNLNDHVDTVENMISTNISESQLNVKVQESPSQNSESSSTIPSTTSQVDCHSKEQEIISRHNELSSPDKLHNSHNDQTTVLTNESTIKNTTYYPPNSNESTHCQLQQQQSQTNLLQITKNTFLHFLDDDESESKPGVGRYKSSPADFLNFNDTEELYIVRKSQLSQQGQKLNINNIEEEAISLEQFLAQKAMRAQQQSKAQQCTPTKTVKDNNDTNLLSTDDINQDSVQKNLLCSSIDTNRSESPSVSIADSENSNNFKILRKNHNGYQNLVTPPPKSKLQQSKFSSKIDDFNSSPNLNHDYSSSNSIGNSTGRTKVRIQCTSDDSESEQNRKQDKIYSYFSDGDVLKGHANSITSSSSEFDQNVSRARSSQNVTGHGAARSVLKMNRTEGSGNITQDRVRLNKDRKNLMKNNYDNTSLSNNINNDIVHHVYYVLDVDHKILEVTEKTNYDLFQIGDVMELLFVKDDWYVARHLVKETEHVFPASQCNVLQPQDCNFILEPLSEKKKHHENKIDRAKESYFARVSQLAHANYQNQMAKFRPASAKVMSSSQTQCQSQVSGAKGIQLPNLLQSVNQTQSNIVTNNCKTQSQTNVAASTVGCQSRSDRNVISKNQHIRSASTIVETKMSDEQQKQQFTTSNHDMMMRTPQYNREKNTNQDLLSHGPGNILSTSQSELSKPPKRLIDDWNSCQVYKKTQSRVWPETPQPNDYDNLYLEMLSNEKNSNACANQYYWNALYGPLAFLPSASHASIYGGNAIVQPKPTAAASIQTEVSTKSMISPSDSTVAPTNESVSKNLKANSQMVKATSMTTTVTGPQLNTGTEAPGLGLESEENFTGISSSSKPPTVVKTVTDNNGKSISQTVTANQANTKDHDHLNRNGPVNSVDQTVREKTNSQSDMNQRLQQSATAVYNASNTNYFNVTQPTVHSLNQYNSGQYLNQPQHHSVAPHGSQIQHQLSDPTNWSTMTTAANFNSTSTNQLNINNYNCYLNQYLLAQQSVVAFHHGYSQYPYHAAQAAAATAAQLMGTNLATNTTAQQATAVTSTLSHYNTISNQNSNLCQTNSSLNSGAMNPSTTVTTSSQQNHLNNYGIQQQYHDQIYSNKFEQVSVANDAATTVRNTSSGIQSQQPLDHSQKKQTPSQNANSQYYPLGSAMSLTQCQGHSGGVSDAQSSKLNVTNSSFNNNLKPQSIQGQVQVHTDRDINGNLQYSTNMTSLSDSYKQQYQDQHSKGQSQSVPNVNSNEHLLHGENHYHGTNQLQQQFNKNQNYNYSQSHRQASNVTLAQQKVDVDTTNQSHNINNVSYSTQIIQNQNNKNNTTNTSQTHGSGTNHDYHQQQYTNNNGGASASSYTNVTIPPGYNSYLIPLLEKVERGTKFLCTFMVGIIDDDYFCVARRIIGAYGKHMKTISSIIPGGKVRLRGRGSGFHERDTGLESPDPLQINVSVPSKEGYVVAKFMLTSLLSNIYQEYQKVYSVSRSKVEVRLLEHPRNPAISEEWIKDYKKRNPIFEQAKPYENPVSIYGNQLLLDWSGNNNNQYSTSNSNSQQQSTSQQQLQQNNVGQVYDSNSNSIAVTTVTGNVSRSNYHNVDCEPKQSLTNSNSYTVNQDSKSTVTLDRTSTASRSLNGWREYETFLNNQDLM